MRGAHLAHVTPSGDTAARDLGACEEVVTRRGDGLPQMLGDRVLRVSAWLWYGLSVARVFISHASTDKPTVRRIRDALVVAGHEAWLDEDEILVGESIPKAIERGLTNADFVVLCLSNDAAERGWVDAERDIALMQQMGERTERILPVRLENVALPRLIANLKYVDLFPDDDAYRKGVDSLTKSLKAYESRRGSALTAEGAPQEQKRALPLEQAIPPFAPASNAAMDKQWRRARWSIGGAVLMVAAVAAAVVRPPSDDAERWTYCAVRYDEVPGGWVIALRPPEGPSRATLLSLNVISGSGVSVQIEPSGGCAVGEDGRTVIVTEECSLGSATTPSRFLLLIEPTEAHPSSLSEVLEITVEDESIEHRVQERSCRTDAATFSCGR